MKLERRKKAPIKEDSLNKNLESVHDLQEILAQNHMRMLESIKDFEKILAQNRIEDGLNIDDIIARYTLCDRICSLTLKTFYQSNARLRQRRHLELTKQKIKRRLCSDERKFVRKEANGKLLL